MTRGIGKTELESILASNPRMIGPLRGTNMSGFSKTVLLIVIVILLAWSYPLPSMETQERTINLDEQVRSFLQKMQNRWADLNVPEEDGRILHDIVVKKNYKKALELGTSTGRSGILIAWALSKTGGRLITVEIDESRITRQ